MLAMLLEQPRQPLVLRNVPDPQPGPRQVLLQVRACAVCRTDLHVCDGELANPKLPLIPGHEIVGTVIGMGADVHSLKIGDRVGVPWLGSSCCECVYCRAGQENLCDNARFTGYQIDGGYAERTVADERFCFRIPELYNDVEAAPLLCAGLIGYRSLRMTGDATRLGIFGFGAAAHIVTQAAHFQGRRVFALTRPGDIQAQEFARSLGVDWAGDSTSCPPEELDGAIIFAPVGSLIPLALKTVRKGGIVVCGGIHMSDIPSFPYSLLWGERVLRSVANLTRRDAEEFLTLAPKVPVKTVTQVFPLREANTALDRLRSGQLTGAAVLVSDEALHDTGWDKLASSAVPPSTNVPPPDRDAAPSTSEVSPLMGMSLLLTGGIDPSKGKDGPLNGAALRLSSAQAVEPTGRARGREGDAHDDSDPLHPVWLDALTKPETYPHSVSRIEVSQTHISWVALTGDWAYKLKKPVDFGFVNFTEADRRRTDCLEELRLNQRTAPELYKDVVALTSEETGPRFGGNGPVLEYAVRMRQFPQEDLLNHRLAKNDLPDDLAELLARQVADLHLKAARAAIESPFGEPDVIRQSVQECLEPLNDRAPLCSKGMQSPHPEPLFAQSRGEGISSTIAHGHLEQFSLPDAQQVELQTLKQWTHDEWNNLHDTFIERKRRGWVRECHGDLHLGNIVYFGGKPTLFDCLEFNPNLRWIDVISDVAFLVMDLLDHQASSLAWRFLNAWLERTGDFRGLRVLKYFCVYRALVRAKVAALRLQQSEPSSVDAKEQRQCIHDYVQLACGLIRSDPPVMILMHGVSGSGKSFVARQIASSLGAIQIRSDVERKRMFDGKPSRASRVKSPAAMYAPRSKALTYKWLEVLAGQIVGAGYSVVVDATFLLREQRLRFVSMGRERGVSVVVVACTAPHSILKERVEQRQAIGQDPSDASVAVLDQQLITLEPIEPSESKWTVVSNTTAKCQDAVIQSIRRLLNDESQIRNREIFSGI